MKRINCVFLVLFSLLLLSGNSFGQDDILFRKYILKSGFHGLLYGGAAVIILDLDGPAAAGIPVITSGGSMLAPALFSTNKSISFDELVLSGHGKSVGWIHGFALSTLILGEETWEEEGLGKLTVGIGALSSIGGGILGRSLAKKHEWSDGRTELYRHYGWLTPFTGFSIMAAFSDEPRLWAAGTLLGGAAGYFIGDRVSDWNDYTRGEVRATQVLSSLNMGLGFGLWADLTGDDIEDEDEFNQEYFLLPAVGAIAGTFAGHFWTRNSNLTPQQGMLTAYAATGGAVIGLGIALITESENLTPYYLIPYLTGMGAYATALEMLKKRNGSTALLPDRKGNDFHVSFLPQNFFINNKIQEKGFMINGRHVGLQPLFAATLTF
jgi:hypothetical protein